MAQEYIASKEKNDLGLIALNKSVFQTIAKIVIDEDDKIKLKESSKPFKNAISCRIQDDQLIFEADVKINYLANVNDICNKVQKKIFENIEHMTGIRVDVIDLHVIGFIF